VILPQSSAVVFCVGFGISSTIMEAASPVYPGFDAVIGNDVFSFTNGAVKYAVPFASVRTSSSLNSTATFWA
jgi:hypothetical protein